MRVDRKSWEDIVRLKLIGLCSVFTLVFGYVWADLGNSRTAVQNLWKKTVRKANQPKLRKVVGQVVSKQKAEQQGERDANKSKNNMHKTSGYQIRDLSEESMTFLTTVKKVISYGEDIEELKQFLTTYDGNINAVDSFGDTALIIAVQNREDDVMKCLIENGADVNLPGKSGSTPLTIAVSKNRIDIVDYLLEKGANVNLADADNGDTPLTIAIGNGFENMTSHLIEKGANINNENEIGQTPIMYAVENLREEAVKKLIRAGAHLDYRDTEGKTALVIGYSVQSEINKKIAELEDQGSTEENQADTDIPQSVDSLEQNEEETFAQRRARLSRMFAANQGKSQGQTVVKKKKSIDAEKKILEGKARIIANIIHLLQQEIQVRDAVVRSEQGEQQERTKVFSKTSGAKLEQNTSARSKKNRIQSLI